MLVQSHNETFGSQLAELSGYQPQTRGRVEAALHTLSRSINLPLQAIENLFMDETSSVVREFASPVLKDIREHAWRGKGQMNTVQENGHVRMSVHFELLDREYSVAIHIKPQGETELYVKGYSQETFPVFISENIMNQPEQWRTTVEQLLLDPKYRSIYIPSDIDFETDSFLHS